jgi:hypothetical protein
VRLIGGMLSCRVWVDRDREPRPICLGIAKLRFALDAGEAVELARQLVAAVDEVRATVPNPRLPIHPPEKGQP